MALAISDIKLSGAEGDPRDNHLPKLAVNVETNNEMLVRLVLSRKHPAELDTRSLDKRYSLKSQGNNNGSMTRKRSFT